MTAAPPAAIPYRARRDVLVTALDRQLPLVVSGAAAGRT